MINKLIFIFLFACLLVSIAQAQETKRIEIEMRNNENDIAVVPAGADGLILFSQVTPGKYNFTKYTTDLQQDWSIDCVVNSSLDLSKYVYRNNALYLLFNRFKSPTYQVVKLNVRA